MRLSRILTAISSPPFVVKSLLFEKWYLWKSHTTKRGASTFPLHLFHLLYHLAHFIKLLEKFVYILYTCPATRCNSFAATAIDDGKEVKVYPGDLIYTADGNTHAITNTGKTPMVMLATVIYENK